MLNIEKEKDQKSLKIAVEGRLDTTTAPDLERAIKEDIDDVDSLLIDLEKLEYISSAGLRVLLAAQKIMNRQGSMIIRNVKPDIVEIFDVTGFVDILNIEES